MMVYKQFGKETGVKKKKGDILGRWKGISRKKDRISFENGPKMPTKRVSIQAPEYSDMIYKITTTGAAIDSYLYLNVTLLTQRFSADTP